MRKAGLLIPSLNFLALVLVFILFTKSGFADESEAMQQAGEFYRNGEFDKAIEIYEDLRNEGYEGTSLYFNLANSYYRVGELGYAIVNYERALKFSPTDEDIKHNLAFANLSTVDRIQPLPTFFLFEWWEVILESFSVNAWTYTAFIFYLILLFLFVFYFFATSISQQKIILFSGLATLAVLAITVSLLIVKANREQTQISGVVVEQSITVKTSPDTKSTDAFVIHEGLKLKLEDKLDDWVKIRLADGKVGWLLEESVEKI
ncbi:MAG: hypothetical protein KJN64_00235 [Ignavibacteria bacterium]|nr:hypothetical protein [Ignavibacteria bacterium]MBT8380957.1 hypothetical protein [Ignavibacteria bacterium]NNL22215.1 hypothetical protein [Ignavibacteriaceae bacterium]